jgi:hypothetical protein
MDPLNEDPTVKQVSAQAAAQKAVEKAAKVSGVEPRITRKEAIREAALHIRRARSTKP